MIFILTGDKDSGKSNFALDLAINLLNKNIIIDGFVSAGRTIPGNRKKFDLIDLGTMELWPLANPKKQRGYIKCRRYYFNPETIKKGETIIERALNNRNDLIIIDEIGKCELDGMIWDPILKTALNTEGNLLIIVAAKNLNDIVDNYALTDYQLLDVSKTTLQQASDAISRTI